MFNKMLKLRFVIPSYFACHVYDMTDVEGQNELLIGFAGLCVICTHILEKNQFCE